MVIHLWVHHRRHDLRMRGSGRPVVYGLLLCEYRIRYRGQAVPRDGAHENREYRDRDDSCRSLPRERFPPRQSRLGFDGFLRQPECY